MEKVVENLKNHLDYENNYYFYHETGSDIGQKICDNGLLLSGENILDVKNILFTTCCPLTEELTHDSEEFANFLQNEIQVNRTRETTEMVILSIPKEEVDDIIEPYDGRTSIGEGISANYVINPQYVLGYINLLDEELVLNENYFDYHDNYSF